MIEDYEFTILYDLYSDRITEEGQQEFILKKRNCQRKWYVSDINLLSDIREIPTRSGRPYKNKCEVYHRTEAKWTTVKGKFHELKKILKEDRKKVKGFYGS